MFSTFTERTSIHPVCHAAGRSTRTKIAWAVITILLTLCFFVCLYYLSSAYQHNYSHTPIKVTDMQGFPKVVVCPNHWIDMEKVAANGISTDQLQYIYGFMGALTHETDIEPYPEMRYFDMEKLTQLKLGYENLLKNHSTLSNLILNLSNTENDVLNVLSCSSCVISKQIRRFVKSSYTCYEILYAPSIVVPEKLIFSLFPGRSSVQPSNFVQVLFGEMATTEHQANSMILRGDFSYDITLQPYEYKQWRRGVTDPTLTCEQICLINIQKEHDVRYFMGEKFDSQNVRYVHSSDESWLADHNLRIIQTLGTTCTNASCRSPSSYYSYQMSTIAYPGTPTKVTIRLGGGKKVITLSAPDQGNLWVNLLSKIGGLSALFLGASISSFVHIICHFCSCGMMKLPRKEPRSVTPMNGSPFSKDQNNEVVVESFNADEPDAAGNEAGSPAPLT